MSRRYVYGTAILTLLFAAGCSETPKATPTGVTLQADEGNGHGVGVLDENGNSPDRHIFETKPVAALSRRGGGTGISYHGGPLLTSGTNVATIYWAAAPIYAGGPAAGTSGNSSLDGSLIGTFLSSIGGSPYFNINTTYYNGSNVHAPNVVNYTQTW